MRTTHHISRPQFVADWSSVSRDTGHTMDWDAVPESFVDEAGTKFVPGGTPMGRTENGIAPRAPESGSGAGDGIPAFCLLATNAREGSELQNRSGYGVIRGGVIYENLLPSELDAETKAELDAAGTGFAWATYGDSTGEG